MMNYYNEHKEVPNYIIFGVLTTAVNWIVFQIFNAGLGMNWSIANVIAWIFSVLFAYVTNRKYVFNSESSHILREFALFVQFRLLSLLLEMFFMYILIELLSVMPFIAKVLTAVIVVTANYFFSKAVIFKERLAKK
jgi:putative flippase GtrA